ncbi:single-stranded-DNA-specific exonuclease RecJ [Ekhidna sp.]|uniref:single-stranded-DNA-specific exonuclease RecJ n=1 Tax=Ekhidna sp. TaxID=2608089 RepID=UPI0032975092
MEKRWVYKENPEAAIVEQLSKEININEYLAKILVQRGVRTFDEAKEFFRPSLSRLHDPFLMKNMDLAVNRLTEAVFSEEKILIYGDYDVDGTTSVSLIYLFLKQLSDKLEFYIPDRYTEGYGISKKGIDYAINNDFTLIIALDCGVRAIDRAAQAKAAGVDLIICDHHLPGDELPDAYALLDPKQEDCKYPFKELSGCGVGFKLLEGFCQQNTIEKEKLFEFLDLVAVSIASDIVPIVDENRILAFYGLKKLNQAPSAGLKSLIEISGKKNQFSISDVVFSIGPRINAAGRLTHAKESVNLLIGDETETSAFADNLNDRNKERREFDQTITTEALEMIGAFKEDRKSTVLFKKDWHKGVIGIVASRCIEHYHRPTIILTESKGKATGSARSVDGFDVHEAISECADLLEQFGGHTHAAGLTMPVKNVGKFIDRFEQIVSEKILPEQLIPKVEIDTEIPLSEITYKTYNIMNQMAPFGPQNMAPLFGTKNVIVDTLPKVLKEKHIKGFLHAENSTKLFEFIGFGMADKMDQIETGVPFHIGYHLEENNYMRNKSLILNLRDIRFDA